MPKKRPASLLAAALAVILALPPLLAAQPLLDEETKQLLVDTVEAATARDFYDRRCRGDQAGRYTENLNKELAGKFRMTVLEVEDSFFPERSYRSARERMQRDFLEKLRDQGGCKGAKEAGMRDTLRERYNKLMRKIDALP